MDDNVEVTEKIRHEVENSSRKLTVGYLILAIIFSIITFDYFPIEEISDLVPLIISVVSLIVSIGIFLKRLWFYKTALMINTVLALFTIYLIFQFLTSDYQHDAGFGALEDFGTMITVLFYLSFVGLTSLTIIKTINYIKYLKQT